jgi:glycosyltransferase involved in cell wall biosynthesis
MSDTSDHHASVEISIVTPMHNEELCIREFHSRLSDVLGRMDLDYEIVLVNDGSTDTTEQIMRELSAADPHLKCVMLSRNRGQCTAIYAGLQNTEGNYVVVMDGDLQHRPEEIPDLYAECSKGYDLVSGTRQKRTESLMLRRLPSLIANYLMRATSKCDCRDMGGMSMLHGETARSLQLSEGQHRLLPALVHIGGGAISEVPIQAPERYAGTSHYGIARSVDVLFDIIMLWFQTSFKQRPLYLFGRISLVFFGVATLAMLWMLYEKFALGVHMGTRPPFLGSVLLYIASMGFMGMGFILEILANIRDGVLGKRPYRIREIIQTRK